MTGHLELHFNEPSFGESFKTPPYIAYIGFRDFLGNAIMVFDLDNMDSVPKFMW